MNKEMVETIKKCVEQMAQIASEQIVDVPVDFHIMPHASYAVYEDTDEGKREVKVIEVRL